MEEEKKEINKENGLSVLERAEALNKALEEKLNRMQEETKKLEELKAVSILSGKTEAGQVQEKPKVETAKEYKDRILRGV